jgi:predicted DNA-binding transcriptional regulator AlpA
MAGPILRLKDLMVHTGLSRSAIYDRMDTKSPRYAEDFPKSFPLGGGAIGWFKNEVDAWLEICATNAANGMPSRKTQPSSHAPRLPAQEPPTAAKRKATQKPVQKPSSQPTSEPDQSTAQFPSQPRSRPRTLGQAIVEGERINAHLLHYLEFKTWTPAVGAMLIAGIDPPLGCNEIPDVGIGLDEKPLDATDSRFRQAHHIFKEWHEWKDDSGDPSLDMKPLRFLDWCMREDISTEWLLLFLELCGFADKNTVDLTASRLALLANR